MKKLHVIFGIIAITVLLSGCNSGVTNSANEAPTNSPIVEETDTEKSSEDSSLFIETPSGSSSSNEELPYSEEELKSDPRAPSTNIEDYNSDGEYVPADGISDDPGDYNANGIGGKSCNKHQKNHFLS